MLTNRPSGRTLMILSFAIPLLVYFGFELESGQNLAGLPNSIAMNRSFAKNETPAIRQIPVPRPPMGWSSWNSFSNTVSSAVIMQQAKALVASGAQKAGYEYVNIDEGWWLGERDQRWKLPR